MKLDNKDFNIKPRDLLKWQNGNTLETGFFKTAMYPNGTPVASVAFFNEYGTIRTPARPFMRNAIEKNSNKWLNQLKNDCVKNVESRTALARLGELVKSDIMKSITALNAPANAESTIKRKKSSNPLIDTGFMRRSVTYKVTL